MLSIGIDNFVADASITASNSAAGRGPNSVKTSDITHWQAGSTNSVLTAEITTAEITSVQVQAGGVDVDAGGEPVEVRFFILDLVTAHRITFDGTLIVRAFFGTDLVSQKTYTPDDISGIEVFSLFATSGLVANKLTLTFFGGTAPPSIGYLWIGTKIDFEVTQYQDADETGDIGSISQGGYAGNSRRPILRTLTCTLAHEESGSLKSKLRQILKSGYTVPRPVVRVEDCLPEMVMLGVLDAEKIGYDFFENKDSGLRKAQATIGFSEVLGGI